MPDNQSVSGDGSFIEPYLAIPFYIIFTGVINGSVIYFDFHGIICYQ